MMAGSLREIAGDRHHVGTGLANAFHQRFDDLLVDAPEVNVREMRYDPDKALLPGGTISWSAPLRMR
jgi:hypothetical protein